MRTRVNQSSHSGVPTRLKPVRSPGDTPNFPKPNQHAPGPRNAPNLPPVQHNTHPRTSVNAPWRPDAPQNRQDSRAHTETPRNTPKHPQTCRPEDGDCLVEVGAVGQFSFYRSWHHQNFRRVGWGPHRHNSQIPNSARLSDQNGQLNFDHGVDS